MSILAASALVSLASYSLAGCGEAPLIKTTDGTTTTTATTPAGRLPIDYYRGVAEPRSEAWTDLANDANRLRADGFNAVMINPPVLVSQRAGGKTRVALEGAAQNVPDIIDDLHRSGLAAHLAPTSASPGFDATIDPTETNLEHLSEDTLKWATTAEEKQVELFSPLAQYNLALGTAAAGQWSAAILPQIREKYHGPVAAMVVPDLLGPPPAGGLHDFEQLSYKGYDYIMLDIFPREMTNPFDQDRFEAQVADILAHAISVAQRDGVPAILVRCGAWRERAGLDPLDGPELGETVQARVIGRVLEMTAPEVMPQIKGVFYEGWTLPGRGARDYAVEQVLKNAFFFKSRNTQ